jgi:hypothetical protein
VTPVDSDLQLCFIEHVAHLTSKDYAYAFPPASGAPLLCRPEPKHGRLPRVAAFGGPYGARDLCPVRYPRRVPADLVALGFVPQGKEEAILQTECVEVLTKVYGEFAGGGGAAKIDVSFVIAQLSGLSAKYGNLFQVPPYFAYIARAFGVLEGIGLSNDPDYAIVGECLPYIAQRLLTDPNPRVGGALDSFVFGARATAPDRVLDADRLELILEGFGSYGTSASGLAARPPVAAFPSESPAAGAAAAPVEARATAAQVARLADTLLALLLTPEPTPLQGLVIDQLAKVTAAAARAGLAQARRASGGAGGGRSLLGLVVDPFGLFQVPERKRRGDVGQSARACVARSIRICRFCRFLGCKKFFLGRRIHSPACATRRALGWWTWTRRTRRRSTRRGGSGPCSPAPRSRRSRSASGRRTCGSSRRRWPRGSGLRGAPR